MCINFFNFVEVMEFLRVILEFIIVVYFVYYINSN